MKCNAHCVRIITQHFQENSVFSCRILLTPPVFFWVYMISVGAKWQLKIAPLHLIPMPIMLNQEELSDLLQNAVFHIRNSHNFHVIITVIVLNVTRCKKYHNTHCSNYCRPFRWGSQICYKWQTANFPQKTVTFVTLSNLTFKATW